MSIRRRHYFGYITGSLFGLMVFMLLSSSQLAAFRMPGPSNTGHAKLACTDCHLQGRGTLRQQLQANVRYLLGQRQHSVALGYRQVTNRECIKCHERPNDTHPVYRFFEPKYKTARTASGAHQCQACHREHAGKRITTEAEFCQHCHDQLSLTKDPIDIPHQSLVQNKRWSSCLQCHDYHGNHKMKAVTTFANRIDLQRIDAYFENGRNPYPGEVVYKAKEPKG